MNYNYKQNNNLKSIDDEQLMAELDRRREERRRELQKIPLLKRKFELELWQHLVVGGLIGLFLAYTLGAF